MRHRPIQTAPHERVPLTFWGRQRIRTVLATVAAAATGLMPVVMVPTPALAANASSVDNLTISDAGNWEGGKITFTVTYTGSAPGDFTFATADGTALGVASYAGGSSSIGTNDYLTGLSRTGTITFPGTAAGTSNTITITADTQKDADTADETFSLVATDTLGNNKSGTGTIWAASSYPTFALSPVTSTVAETATKNSSGTLVQKTVAITAKLTSPLPHPVTLPVKTVDGPAGITGATSAGGELRDFDALPATATITIPAFTYTGSTSVQLYDDAVDETNVGGQTFTVVSAGTPTVLATTPSTTDTSTITITDDDDPPVASVGDATAPADEGGYLTYPVTLDHPSDSPNLSVSYYNSPGTAMTGSNASALADLDTPDSTYISSAPHAAPIPAYAPGRNISVKTATDSAFEGAENTKLTLSAPVTDLTVSTTKASGVGIINDLTAGPNITLATVIAAPGNNGDPLPEGDSGEKVQKIKVTAAAGTYPVPIKIDWTTKDGTAKAGSDYKAASGSITIPANTDTTNWADYIPVTILGDTVLEGPENFKITLSSSTGTIGNAGDSTIGITEAGEADAKPTFNVGDVSVKEGNSGTTLAQVPITLSAPSASDTTFTYSFPNGADTAVSTGSLAGDKDYDQPSATTVVIKAGDKTGTLSIPINGDTVYEKDQSLSVLVATSSSDVDFASTPYVKHTAVVTIGNDDALPTLTFNNSNVTEGGDLTVTGKIVGVSEYPYILGLTVGGADKDPATPGADFKAPDSLTATKLSIPRGYSGALTEITPATTPTYSWTVPTLEDQIDEPTESFIVTANEITGALTGFAPAIGTYKIADDPLDTPPASTIGDVTANEKDGWAQVPVDLSFTGDATSTTQNVTLQYNTADGSAKQGKDYVLTKGVLTVPPGTMKAWIKVPLLDDMDQESDETFSVRISNPNPLGAQIINGDSTVTIKSDDTVPPIAPTLTLTGPAKGTGSVTAWGRATPGSEVELHGAALPAMDKQGMKVLATTMADHDGNFRFSPRAITSGWSFWVRTGDWTTSLRTIKLTQSPALTVSTTKGKLTAAVAGNPKASGQTVTIQRKSGNSWVTVASGKTTATGYKGTWSFRSGTKLTLRALVSGNTGMGINAGYSATKTITIK
ncbi:Calx-beta domain-containing protein [Actinoplanes sp. HUAS TT8]|uniref:Calx-beta domain-containing protein n=1 Tax=Actinoplanes sp. HUAS TT8 TaxID=3447453 RepID=UPI003F51B620